MSRMKKSPLLIGFLLSLTILLISVSLNDINNMNNSNLHYQMLKEIHSLHNSTNIYDIVFLQDQNNDRKSFNDVSLYAGYAFLFITILLIANIKKK